VISPDFAVILALMAAELVSLAFDLDLADDLAIIFAVVLALDTVLALATAFLDFEARTTFFKT